MTLPDAALPTYTIAGRHRREAAPAGSVSTCAPPGVARPGTGAVEVLVNGFPATATGTETAIQVPSGAAVRRACPVTSRAPPRARQLAASVTSRSSVPA